MNTGAPEWLEIAGPMAWSAAMTVGVFWQPKWMHRLFNWLVSQTRRLQQK